MAEQKLLVRTSERRDFMECRWRWWMAYVNMWKPKEPAKPLVFGDLTHQALAAYYIKESAKRRRRGPHPAETFKRLVLESEIDFMMWNGDEEEQVNMLDLGVDMLTNYIDEYGKDEQWVILYPEMPFQIDVHDEDGNYICTYVGTTDALMQDLRTGLLGLFEHKTAAAISTEHLFLDEQSSSYWTFVPEWLRENDVLKQNEDLHFMLYNFLKKGKKDRRPQNEVGQYLNKPGKPALLEAAEAYGIEITKPRSVKVSELMALLEAENIDPMQFGEVSARQPSALFHREYSQRGTYERGKLLRRVAQQVKEMNEIRSGEREALKSPGRDCRFCAFKDVCELEEIGSDWEELLQMTFRKWDPYTEHKEGEFAA